MFRKSWARKQLQAVIAVNTTPIAPGSNSSSDDDDAGIVSTRVEPDPVVAGSHAATGTATAPASPNTAESLFVQTPVSLEESPTNIPGIYEVAIFRTRITAFYKRFPAELRQLILAELFPDASDMPDSNPKDPGRPFCALEDPANFHVAPLLNHNYHLYLDHFVQADVAKFFDVRALELLKRLRSVDEAIAALPQRLNRRDHDLRCESRQLGRCVRSLQRWLDGYMGSGPGERR